MDAKPASVQWEYAVLTADLTHKHIYRMMAGQTLPKTRLTEYSDKNWRDTLNQMGADGWELVSVNTENGNPAAYFKKRLPEKP